MENFDYDDAFSRNIGWITRDEQKTLRGKRVAIAGLGGVGGIHLLTLARLGVGSFSIADLDVFETANFNRQIGATIDTLGRAKLDVLAEMALDINPTLELRRFPDGISPENAEDFLAGADVYVDGLDFFAFSPRQSVFRACRKLGIPAVTAAPLGMGAAVLVFTPDGISFDDYFCFDGADDLEKAIRFMVGLAPKMAQRSYLADPSSVSLTRKKGPSTIMACQLCAGLAATETLKIILNRGKLVCAPSGYQFDGYTNKLHKTWIPFGNRNPLQKMKISIARKIIARIEGERS